MGLKKKKNIIILTFCMVICFILYQLYFFLTITSENTNNGINPILDHQVIKDLIHLRSEDDKYINENGLIRGVYYLHMPLYRPDSENKFKCRISKNYIDFDKLNDNFCDCDDGTDEPSTSACPNGVFYCQHQYKRKPITLHTIPSSKVNDGICDCCDGSDEWVYDKNQRLLSQVSPKNYRHYVLNCLNMC